MHNSILLLTTAALLANAMPSKLDARGFNVPTCGDFAQSQKWATDAAPWQGGSGSKNPFCVTAWQSGHYIKSLKAYKETSKNCKGAGAISRLEIGFSDSSTVVLGSDDTTCTAGQLNRMSDDEVITKIQSQAAGDNPTAQGKTMIITSDQNGKQIQQVWLKDEHNPKASSWWPDVDGGVLLGLTGYISDSAILQINYHFTPGKLQSVTRDGFYFTDNDLHKIQIVPTSIDSQSFGNGDPKNDQTFSWAKLNTVDTTVSTSTTKTVTLGVSVSVTESVGIPDIGDISSTQEFDWTHTTTTVDAKSSEQSTTISWNQGGTIPAASIVDCTATAGQASGNIPFTSTVHLQFSDGSSLSYNETGTLSASKIVSSHVVVNCTPRSGNSTSSEQPHGKITWVHPKREAELARRAELYSAL